MLKLLRKPLLTRRLTQSLPRRGILSLAADARATTRPTDDEYDYIIVGAGTAGCLLGNRLSANPNNKVLVLEAGPPDTYPWIHVPLGYLYTMTHPSTSWGFHTVPQPWLNGRSLWYPRGRVLGGCSSINGMIYQRGQRRDFDRWSDMLQNSSGGSSSKADGRAWSASDMYRYFDQHLDYAAEFSEEAQGDQQEEVGSERPWSALSGGEWRVEKQRLSWEILDDFSAAAATLGLPQRQHFNSSDQAGCGYFQVNQRSGLRLSAHGAFLRPVMARSNLHVRSSLHVERLSVETLEGTSHQEASQASTSSSATAAVEAEWPRVKDQTTNGGDRYLVCRGVEVQAANDVVKGALRKLRARKEVILAAGAVGSPHILQCSGIGPSALLQDNGVKPIHPLPGVGQNLQDHLQIRPVFQLGPDAITLNSWKKAGSLVGQALIGLEYMWQRSGPLAMAPSQLGLFAHSGVPHPFDGGGSGAASSTSSKLGKGSPGSAASAHGQPSTPDLQFHVQPLSLGNLSDSSSLHPFPGMTASVCNLRPTSRGSVGLTGPSTRQPPAIDPNYLSTDHDRAVAVASMHLARNLVLKNQAFTAKHGPVTEHTPGEHLKSDEELATAAGNIATSIFHPVGTCKMGHSNDPMTVVDERLRVLGVVGLRVADASVMPSITSGNTNSPTLAIAEKAAEMILADRLNSPG